MTTEERLRRVEDFQAICNLKGRYTQLADSDPTKPHEGAGISELFTEGATWHIVPTGAPLHGRDAIREKFDDAELFPFSYHLLGNPRIEIDGDEARGHWHVVVAFRTAQTGPMWVTGFYEDRFVRVGGDWKISSLICTASHAAPFGEPW